METPEPSAAPVTGEKLLVTDVDFASLGREARVIRIVPGGRYAIIAEDMAEEEIKGLIGGLSAWMESDKQFCVLMGVNLVRVDQEDPNDSAHRG